MALEERGCLQGSADTLQPVKVTVLELQKKTQIQAISVAGNLHKNHCIEADRKVTPEPSILPQTFPFGESPPFLWSTSPFGFYSTLWTPWLSKLSESLCFCELVLSAECPCCVQHLIQQLLLFLLPWTRLIDQLFTSSVLLALSQSHITRHFCNSVISTLQSWSHRQKGFHNGQHTDQDPWACSSITANCWKALNILRGLQWF